jgi:glutamate-ammonia-ligase adenylyltransferase
MDIDTLVQYLDSPADAAPWLTSLGLSDLRRAHENLVAMARAGMTLDLLAEICRQLAEHLPGVADPDMALNNLDRYVAAARNPLALGSLLERDREALPILLQIFSTSQHLSNVLVRDPQSYDLLRITDGQPVSREILVNEICSEVESLPDERSVMTALRRYKHRETLRIVYGDFVKGQSVQTATQQISFLADAVCEAAFRAAWKQTAEKRRVPQRDNGLPARFVVLALGKLGGEELNYSSDIDLIFLCDEPAADPRRAAGHAEFFDRLARQIIKLLTEPTELGAAFRVDVRLRPDGRQGPLVIGVERALQYYDLKGRTWERQAYVKARAISGDREMGNSFLRQMEPWVYRKYLSRADISGIKALKRRIEQRALRDGGDLRNVKTGHGGIRDIEFVIQFLQLLNGGDLPEIRTGNTLTAMDRLAQVGCLTMREHAVLRENYEFLRDIEHRLQVLFDLQTHTIPDDEQELRKLAIRLGYSAKSGADPLESFKSDYRSKTELNRKILDHLLHDAFGEEDNVEPEVDLVLDPDPPRELIEQVLGGLRFRDVRAAYENLTALATEKIEFLSTRRCRHFLAAIAPALLRAISRTPDPDFALVNLRTVSESLGGKGVVWELFHFNPPTLDLYVRMCASSSYLCSILTSNPGMVDELMDSLVLGKLPTLVSLEESLDELCRGAEDLNPILHSFKTCEHLNVGVQDILGKVDIRTVHRTLSDIAQVCLTKIAQRDFDRLVEKYGLPTIGEGPRAGQPCELIILALGKLGGREPNYHSDLDVVFLYEAEGMTQHTSRSRRGNATTNQHFFSELGQKIIKDVNSLGPYGRLYELDPRLRPTGRSGALAVSLDEFSRYFRDGQGQLWERQALCKARPIYGSSEAQAKAAEAVRTAIVAPGWRSEDAAEIRKMRGRLEETASRQNLKRGAGGTVDIEFTVQMLQLHYAAQTPEVLEPGTLDALRALHEHSYLSDDDFEGFSTSYRFLRRVEAGLRLMNTTARHDFPQDTWELKKLAYLLEYDSPERLAEDCRRYTQENRARFERIFRGAAER